MADAERDELSGTDTTGHDWDGIKELNTPMPRWWLYTLWVTVVWGIIYSFVYPAWPTLSDYSKGFLGYSSRMNLEQSMQALKGERAEWMVRFEQSPVEELVKDPDLLNFALAGGRAIFGENCAPCHGSGGAGAKGYPILADDDWLWGGDLAAIYETIRAGVRSGDEEARESEMPRFGADEILNGEQITQVADYVASLAAGPAAAGPGMEIFADECAACHGEDGKGMSDLGAPNLTDGIWLYGGTKEAITAQITAPKHGVMPTWGKRLDDASIKQVSIYVHTLGGGQ